MRICKMASETRQSQGSTHIVEMILPYSECIFVSSNMIDLLNGDNTTVGIEEEILL